MDQLKKLNDIITFNFLNSNINYDEINDFKLRIIKLMETEFEKPNYDLINYNLDKYFKCVIVKNNDYKGKIIYDKDNLVIPRGYKKKIKHLKKLNDLPQPEQRTPEWFDMRETMLTASSAAKHIGESKYGKPKDTILEKMGYKPFIQNKYVHHGKKYEEIATKLYENIFNVQINEYGLVQHQSKPQQLFIGASPDGITNKYCLDNSFNKKLGRMVEIKCPYSRVIKTEGEIDGGIVTHDYWCQMQQQLECCDLELCDFWQCNIKEYFNRDEWLEDNEPTLSTEEQNIKKNIPVQCQKGMIIQLLPKNKFNRNVYDAKYIYPKNLDINMFNYDQWVLDIIINFDTKYRYITDNYVFDKILYWKLVNSHNVCVLRDKEWFKTNLPKYKKLWDEITHLKDNPKDAEIFLNKYNKKKSKKPKYDAVPIFVDSDSE